MSNDQSSGIKVIIISVYDLDGKGQIRYGPGHLEALAKQVFFSMGGGGGVGEWRRYSGQCFLFKNHAPWCQERGIIFS